MDSTPHSAQGVTDTDITKQAYQGPSIVSAMAGEGFIAHFQWALTAIAAVGAAALIFKQPTAKALNGVRDWAEGRLIANPTRILDRFKNGTSNLTLTVFGHGERQPQVNQIYQDLGAAGVHRARYQRQERDVGLGLWIANHTVGLISPIKQAIFEATENNPALKNAFSAAGPFAFVGYFILPLFLSGSGFRKGRAGRQQFETAQDTIVQLRAENNTLRSQSNDLMNRLSGRFNGGDREQPAPQTAKDTSEPATQETTAALSTEPAPAPRAEPTKGERRWGDAVAAQKADAQTREAALS